VDDAFARSETIAGGAKFLPRVPVLSPVLLVAGTFDKSRVERLGPELGSAVGENMSLIEGRPATASVDGRGRSKLSLLTDRRKLRGDAFVGDGGRDAPAI
jgi:hypothetical protein